jgi:hypothetical protein
MVIGVDPEELPGGGDMTIARLPDGKVTTRERLGLGAFAVLLPPLDALAVFVFVFVFVFELALALLLDPMFEPVLVRELLVAVPA